jgi:hypothetical protein
MTSFFSSEEKSNYETREMREEDWLTKRSCSSFG